MEAPRLVVLSMGCMYTLIRTKGMPTAVPGMRFFISLPTGFPFNIKKHTCVGVGGTKVPAADAADAEGTEGFAYTRMFSSCTPPLPKRSTQTGRKCTRACLQSKPSASHDLSCAPASSAVPYPHTSMLYSEIENPLCGCEIVLLTHTNDHHQTRGQNIWCPSLRYEYALL